MEETLRSPEDEKSQKEWISHIVATSMLEAAGAISRGKDPEECRRRLIDGLRSKTGGNLVDEIIELAEQHDWLAEQDLDKFRAEYFKFEEKYGMSA